MNQISKKVNPFSTAAISNGLSKVGELLKTKKFWVELIIMTLGMFVAALGVYFFLIPSKLIVGSITGLSIVISKLLPFISVGNVIFIINAVLLVLSFILIGNEFGAKTHTWSDGRFHWYYLSYERIYVYATSCKSWDSN